MEVNLTSYRWLQVMVKAVKKDELNERDFYLIITAKIKSMNRTRKGKSVSLNEGLIKEEKKR